MDKYYILLVAAFGLGTKMWYDTVKLLQTKIRMKAYVQVTHELTSLIKTCNDVGLIQLKQ